MTTTAIIPQVEKSIKFDRESKDYCCTLLLDGEPVSLGYASTYSQAEEWCNAEYYRILQDGTALPPRDEVSAAPVVEAEPVICKDTVDQRNYGAVMGTAYRAGEVEVYVPLVSGNPYDVPTLYIGGANGICVSEFEQVLPDILAALHAARMAVVQAQAALAA